MINSIENAFGIKIDKLKKLSGYDNENYLLVSGKSKYILKKYPFTKENHKLVTAENDCLQFLNKEDPSIYPKPVSGIEGSLTEILSINKKKYVFRILSYIEGKFLGEVNHDKKLFNSLGSFLAKMNKLMIKYNNDAISSRIWEWDIQYLHLNNKYIDDIPKAENKKLVLYFFQQFEEVVSPKLPYLRKSIIHNDANEWNILTNKGKVTGIIDFGDLAYSQLVNEVAIAMTYGSYDKDDPLHYSTIILESYHKILPLKKEEISLLYYLISAMLCISVCNSAHSRKNNPKNKHALISEKNAWKMLIALSKLSPVYVENHYMKSLGFTVKKKKKVNQLIKNRHKIISPILSLSYKNPIAMDRSAFQYMFDIHGKTYLDAYNNVPHVGHSHPKVIEAASKQMKKLNTNTRYLYDIIQIYGSRLLNKFPKTLNKIYFVNSGSEASDLAIKLALSYSKNKKIMVMENGYHGNTQRCTDISDYKFNNKKGQGKKDYIIKVPMPNEFNSKYSKGKNGIGIQYANDAIKNIENVAAFICEPILGCGGQVPLPGGYLNKVYNKIRNNGGVCISDEVQTGFGRLGNVFWGYEMYDVIPDIVILGKPMGNGHPIGAVVTTDDIANSFGKGVEFFSSFGGNPVSCAVGLSVLDIIEEENLQENAKNVGNYYMSELKKLQKQYKFIGDVRGSGLFIGIEIVEKNTKKPNTELAQKIKNNLREKHILVGTDGPFNNVIKSKPPICFTKENAKTVVDSIKDILKKL
ncbi:MAG: aminotransferase class III-fold pyridoxal phosphate-dependent enzyme [Bacteroidota bacterium]|nr:aminotransferase class III-fold pyridoxal phosphate-dependent enzyme [Bacteroidota bacterium]|tara:strand:+ start:1273 stop:3522 length:2250 start_codon:yes stop_codon:yes gene_type:complete